MPICKLEKIFETKLKGILAIKNLHHYVCKKNIFLHKLEKTFETKLRHFL